jgi:hypothetical protein
MGPLDAQSEDDLSNVFQYPNNTGQQAHAPASNEENHVTKGIGHGWGDEWLRMLHPCCTGR